MDLNTAVSLVQTNLSPDLRKKRWQGETHPLGGLCYVGAEALYHLLGDPNWIPQCARYTDDKGKSTYWWLKNKLTGEISDPTAEQFPYPFPYETGRGTGFLTKHPSKRAKLVLERINAAKAR